MKIEVQYKWRTLWAGKMSTTRIWYTAEEIRKLHPEAVRLDHTRREVQVPETPEELAERWRNTDTSWSGRHIPGAPSDPAGPGA